MKAKLVLLSVLIFLGACSQQQTATSSSAEAVEANQANFEIDRVVGNLYRGRSGRHHTVFLVTNDGTILADPINLEFAQWLKTELATRFNSTVRYVLYSHYHWDHASGGAVFSDTAEFVGHQNMIAGLSLPLPANYMASDLNGDGAIQRDEAGGGLQANFDTFDINADNQITGTEINVNIVPPGVTYSDNHVVYLGGREVQMIYAGVNHSDDGSIIYFPEEATAFGVDWLNVNSVPRTLYGTAASDWADSVGVIASLRPTHVVPGHGEIGSRDDLLTYQQYFRDLQNAADSAIAKGLSLEEFQSSLELDAYSSWDGYDTYMPINAREAYEISAAQ